MMYIALLCACSFAAIGQIMLKIGAGHHSAPLVQMLNSKIAMGVVFYIFGTILWIWSLRYVSLHAAYAFTGMTFMFVQISAVIIIGERPTILAIIGASFVIFGVILMMCSQVKN